MSDQTISIIPVPKLSTDIYGHIRETARRFAHDRIRPRAAELDDTETFPADLYEEMAALGLFGITVPDEYSGAGLDALFASSMRRSCRIWSAAISTRPRS